jgi:hypothetical protein
VLALSMTACSGEATSTSASRADAKRPQGANHRRSPASSAASPGVVPYPAVAAGGSSSARSGPMRIRECHQAVASGKSRTVIATDGTGGVYMLYGSGLARVLTAKMPNTEVTGGVRADARLLTVQYASA